MGYIVTAETVSIDTDGTESYRRVPGTYEVPTGGNGLATVLRWVGLPVEPEGRITAGAFIAAVDHVGTPADGIDRDRVSEFYALATIAHGRDREAALVWG